LNPAPLQEIARWVGSYRKLWEQSFDRLEALLQSPASQQKRGKANERK
jgi:hypothetical protein